MRGRGRDSREGRTLARFSVADQKLVRIQASFTGGTVSPGRPRTAQTAEKTVAPQSAKTFLENRQIFFEKAKNGEKAIQRAETFGTHEYDGDGHEFKFPLKPAS